MGTRLNLVGITIRVSRFSTQPVRVRDAGSGLGLDLGKQRRAFWTELELELGNDGTMCALIARE